MSPTFRPRRVVVFLLFAIPVLLGSWTGLLGTCGPFTDVSDATFCPFVLEIFYLGITTGTTPTTYDPASAVSRLQMAAFLSRSVDVIRRGGRRAALDHLWNAQNAGALGLTTVGTAPSIPRFDGADVWVPNFGSASVSRVQASSGKVVETWTVSPLPFAALSAMGRVFVTSATSPGVLSMIDPAQPAGVAQTVASTLGNSPYGITFDGTRIWTANGSGSVSIVTPGATIPWTVTTVSSGFSSLAGALYDGTAVWVTDNFAGTLLKLDFTGSIAQTVGVGFGPAHPATDGTNIWVPLAGEDKLAVVRASTGAVLRVLTGNGMDNPLAASFDGERILVTSFTGNALTLWKAADLTPLAKFSTGASTGPYGVCSDGVNFWIALNFANKLARF